MRNQLWTSHKMSAASVTAAVTFASTYDQFIDDLKGTFPEYAAALTLAGSLPNRQARFVEVWRHHTAAVAAKDARIFAGDGIELVPGFVVKTGLWNELSGGTHAAVWKYLSTLLLLAAAYGPAAAADSAAAAAEETGDDFVGTTETLWDISGFQTSMEAMMKQLQESATSAEAGAAAGAGAGAGAGPADSHASNPFAGLFSQLGKMAESFTGGAGIDLSGAAGAAGAAAAGGFKIPERLFKGHIAKIVEEMVKEFKPEDFGITPEMMESKDPKDMFNYLQEIFTKKPQMLMEAGQKIAKKLQGKFMSGSIKREEIIREVEELMKEFSGNEAFSELFGGLGDMLKASDRESGNEHSARRREVQERLRRKAAEKAAKKTATAGVALVASATPSNAVVTNAVAAAALEAEMLAEDAAASKKAVAKGRKK